MESRGTPPFILNLSNSWSSEVVSLMSWLLDAWAKNTQFPFNSRQGMPHSPTRNFGEKKKSLIPAGNWTPDRPARGPVTILTALNLLTLQPVVTAGITSSPSHVHFLQLTSLQCKPLCLILQHSVFLIAKRMAAGPSTQIPMSKNTLSAIRD